MRRSQKSSAKTFNGFQEHFAVDLDSTVTQEVVVRPANRRCSEGGKAVGRGVGESPWRTAARYRPGIHGEPALPNGRSRACTGIARPWPQVGPLFTKHDFTLDFAGMQVTCPGGHTVPMVPGKQVQFPAVACDACALRAQCTKAAHGQGRSLGIREGRAAPIEAASQDEERDVDGLAANGRRWSTRLRINWCTKDVAPDTKACARTSLMAVVMRRSATSR